jgi:hypothetical protein
MSDSKDWAAIIPEFYFDIISRIPAGTVLLLIIVITSLSQAQMLELKTWLLSGKIEGFPFTIVFVLFFCLGYVMSIPLTMFGALVHILYNRIILHLIKKSYPKEVQALEAKYEAEINKSKFYRLIHDELKQRNRHAMVLLPKMSAEASLCDNLTAALILGVLFVTAFTCVSPRVTHFLLCIAVFSFISGGYRFYRLMIRHVSFARIEGITANAEQPNPADSK